MRKLISLCAVLVGILSCSAQTVVDNFTVGPYIVDYTNQGDVKYRLKDNVDLYEFFELERDTTIIAYQEPIEPLNHGIQIQATIGTNTYNPKEFGLAGLWKQRVADNLYFNAGLSFMIDHTQASGNSALRTTFEIGVPLQIEWSNLSRQKASFYGLFGLTPNYYTTIKAGEGSHFYDGIKKSGLMIAPSLEVGTNVPLGGCIIRLGVFGEYKLNCSNKDFNVYKESVGRAFFGGRLSVII